MQLSSTEVAAPAAPGTAVKSPHAKQPTGGGFWLRLATPIWIYFLFIFPPVNRLIWRPLLIPQAEPGGVLSDARDKDLAITSSMLTMLLPAGFFVILLWVLPWQNIKQLPLRAAQVFAPNFAVALVFSTTIAAALQTLSQSQTPAGLRRYSILENGYLLVTSPGFWQYVLYALGIFVLALIVKGLSARLRDLF